MSTLRIISISVINYISILTRQMSSQSTGHFYIWVVKCCAIQVMKIINEQQMSNWEHFHEKAYITTFPAHVQ